MWFHLPALWFSLSAVAFCVSNSHQTPRSASVLHVRAPRSNAALAIRVSATSQHSMFNVFSVLCHGNTRFRNRSPRFALTKHNERSASAFSARFLSFALALCASTPPRTQRSTLDLHNSSSQSALGTRSPRFASEIRGDRSHSAFSAHFLCLAFAFCASSPPFALAICHPTPHHTEPLFALDLRVLLPHYVFGFSHFELTPSVSAPSVNASSGELTLRSSVALPHSLLTL